MTRIESRTNEICNLIQQKNKLGFGISSPQAKKLEDAVKGLKEELTAADVFPADWTAKYSIGKGNLASVMWIVFLPPGQTTQDGIYVSFCFGKAGNGLVTGCAISNTSKEKYAYVPTIERKNPLIDVDGTRPGTHYNDGYVNPLEVFAGDVDEEILLNHTRESVKKCYECLKLETPQINTVKSVASAERYETWQRFLDKWPVDTVSSLTLDDYTSFGGDRDSFCNWIEIHTDSLGSIWGGSAYKFGIFEHNPTKTGVDDSTHGSDAKYAWYKKYGDSPSAVFPYVKNTILTIINACQSGALADVDAVDFGHAVKWKIAFLYQPMEAPFILPFYKKEMLVALTGMPKDTPTSEMQKKLMDEKPDDMDLFDYYDELLQRLSENDDGKEEGEDAAMSKRFMSINAKSSIKNGVRKLEDVFKDDEMLKRLAAALRTKPFAILAGHSGTGKSRLVRRLAYMTCNDEVLLNENADYNAPGNYCMVQVKPNWHDSTDLLGYYTEMNGGKYHTTPFVEFICKAYAYPETPFFVCLDEMNLAPVEQYFAEFLSAIESYSETTKLTDRLIAEKADADEICGATKLTESLEEVKKHGLTIPRNLFVVGTVNVDETTCQFSRKVLDRAMTILMTAVSFKSMTEPNDPSKEKCLDPAGIRFFLERPTQTALVQGQMDRLDEVQKQIGDTPFAIAYRFANEYALYQAAYQILMDKGVGSDGKPDLNDAESQKTALDHVVLMKLLPRIHGERRVVEGIFKGRKVKGQDGDRDLQGLRATVPDGLSAEMMDKILARPDEYLTFWP